MNRRRSGPSAAGPAVARRRRLPPADGCGPAPTGASRELVVRDWVDAYNARDLEGLLACTSPDVAYRPLHLLGASGSFDGHDGLRRWLPVLLQDPSRHALAVAEYRARPGDVVLAVGTVDVSGLAVATPFCAVYRVTAGLIVVARHYYSDPSLLDRIGLLR